jgi:hypothetical protein
MDFRIRENDGKGFFLTICPWPMLIFRFPSLTLPALIKSFVSVFVRGQYISLLTNSPRIFTAKTRRPLRRSRQVKISCLPLRPSRLRGENALNVLISCNSVANAFSLLTVADASGYDFIPCLSVANVFLCLP